MLEQYIWYAAAGYLCGSILFGKLIAKYMYHVDIVSKSDDHNPGTANVFHYAGVPAGILVLLCELGKGFAPVYLAVEHLDVHNMAFALVMIAPVLGHAYPIGHFKAGGKAIAVSFGVLLGLIPELRPALTLAFFYIFFSVVIRISPHLFRSVAAFICFYVGIRLHYGQGMITTAAFGIAVIVVWRHLRGYQKEKLQIRVL